MFTLILLVFGLVFFILAGLGVPPTSPTPGIIGRFHLIGLGLACWIGAEIIAAAARLGH